MCRGVTWFELTIRVPPGRSRQKSVHGQFVKAVSNEAAFLSIFVFLLFFLIGQEIDSSYGRFHK
ncbi:MAG TPA: hypothetical protein DCY85_10990 [Firmicutes bacterium]|nr:hypothetical protein [Bacillota bacterium]HCF92828.1 hypothetical protein [Bacillota bacterium]